MARTCLVYEIWSAENLMTLICPFDLIKCQILKGKLKGHIYSISYKLRSYDASFMTQPLERSVTLIWPLKIIQGQKVNWKIISGLCICASYKH